jgi:hypothetical protein
MRRPNQTGECQISANYETEMAFIHLITPSLPSLSRTSRHRIPARSWSSTVRDWHCACLRQIKWDGRAIDIVPEALWWLPGIVMLKRVLFGTSDIQLCRGRIDVECGSGRMEFMGGKGRLYFNG